MDFEKFKNNVIKEIEQKKELDEADKKSGIYAIYIENFDYKLMEYEPLIIPIYIGQSKDMYARMLSHRKKLKEIFSYTINEFNNNLKTKKEVLQWYIDMNTGGTLHTAEEIKRVKKLIDDLE